MPDLPADLWERWREWRSTGQQVLLDDPIYGNQLTLDVCELESDGCVTRFALREVSNGVYLFAVPSP